jgi:hypothetical protein
MNSPAIHQAIERLYEDFKRAPKPHGIGFCTCCHTENEIKTLLTTPLRDLGADSLLNYVYSVFYTGGDVRDFLYLLPRCIELCLQPGYPALDVEIVLKKISLAEWRNWPPPLRDATDRLLHTIFDSFGSIELDGHAIDGWLCGASFCFDDIIPFATPLLQRGSTAEANLIAFYEQNSSGLQKGKLVNSFWEEANPNYKRLVDWFQSEQVRSWIAAIYERIYR